MSHAEGCAYPTASTMSVSSGHADEPLPTRASNAILRQGHVAWCVLANHHSEQFIQTNFSQAMKHVCALYCRICPLPRHACKYGLAYWERSQGKMARYVTIAPMVSTAWTNLTRLAVPAQPMPFAQMAPYPSSLSQASGTLQPTPPSCTAAQMQMLAGKDYHPSACYAVLSLSE